MYNSLPEPSEDSFPVDTWPNLGCTVTFVPAEHIEGHTPVAALMYVVEGESVLLVENSRGWEIPGGHVKENEQPLAAAQRELYEEAGVRVGRATMIGYLDMQPTGQQPENGKSYPASSCILVYIGQDAVRDSSYQRPDIEEVHRHAFVSLQDVGGYHHNLSGLNQRVLEYAVQCCRSD